MTPAHLPAGRPDTAPGMSAAEAQSEKEPGYGDLTLVTPASMPEVSPAQRAEILRLLDHQGALTLEELESEVKRELRLSVASVLEFARRRGFITPAAPFEVDGTPALAIAWSLTPAGRSWVIDQRSSVPRIVRRIASETGTALVRTWIPTLLIATLIGVTTGELSRATWIALAIIAVEVAALVAGSWVINRSVRRSVFEDDKHDADA